MNDKIILILAMFSVVGMIGFVIDLLFKLTIFQGSYIPIIIIGIILGEIFWIKKIREEVITLTTALKYKIYLLILSISGVFGIAYILRGIKEVTQYVYLLEFLFIPLMWTIGIIGFFVINIIVWKLIGKKPREPITCSCGLKAVDFEGTDFIQYYCHCGKRSQKFDKDKLPENKDVKWKNVKKK